MDIQNNLEIILDFDKERSKNFNLEKQKLKENYDRRSLEVTFLNILLNRLMLFNQLAMMHLNVKRS